MRTVSAVMDTRWSQGALTPNKNPKDTVSTPGYQDYPQNEWYILVAFEQTKFPVVVQDLDQRNPLVVKRLLSVRGRLEVLDRLHEFVGQSPAREGFLGPHGLLPTRATPPSPRPERRTG